MIYIYIYISCSIFGCVFMLVVTDVNGKQMPQMMMALEKHRHGQRQDIVWVKPGYLYNFEVKRLVRKVVVANAHNDTIDYWCTSMDATQFTFGPILRNCPFVWIDVFMDKYVDKTSRQCSPLGIYARFRVNNMSQMGGVSREFIKTLMVLPRGIDPFEAMKMICADIQVYIYIYICYINTYYINNFSLCRCWRMTGFGSGMWRQKSM